jgi:opacity protein-like surface antigen
MTAVTRHVRRALFALAFILAAASEGQAQGFISPLIGYNFGGDSSCPEFAQLSDCEDKTLNLGVSFGSMNDVLGFEMEIAYARDFFGVSPGFDSSVLTVMGNVMLVPRIGPVRPYALAGLGLMKTQVSFTPESILDSSNNNLGWNLGGGLMVFFGENVGIRGDIRYFHAFQDLELLGFSIEGQQLDFGRAGAALVFKF